MQKISRKIIAIIAVFCMVLSAIPVQAASPSINKKSATIYVNTSINLKINNNKKKVSWSSSNKSIATVTSSGKVTGKKVGTATITGKVGSKKYICKITVRKSNIKVTGISLDKKNISLDIGKTCAVKATIAPSNVTKKSVKWQSSNTSVATVDNNGKVTGKKAGTATITAISTDGSNKKAQCKVTVNDVKVSSMSLSAKGSLTEGSTLQLSVSVKPSCLKKNFTWKSSNISVATVSNTGLVKGLKAGTTKITATTNDKWKTSISATIKVSSKQTSSTKTLKKISATCSLTEASSISDVSTSNVKVIGTYDDGSTGQVSSYSISGSYDSKNYVYTVTSGNLTCTFTVKQKISSSTLSSISCTMSPNYVYVGDDLASGQLKVYATYSDGTKKEITDYTSTFSPQSKVGDYSFKISYRNLVTTVTIKVKKKNNEPTLTEINASYNKSYIYSDETPSASDITLIGTYSDGFKKNLTDFTFDYTPAAGQDQKAVISVHYAGKTMNINVTSLNRTDPKNVSFEYTHDVVKVGENIDPASIKVTVTDYDGNVTNPTDFSVNYTPQSAAGSYEFTVSYKEFSQTFTVNVTE